MYVKIRSKNHTANGLRRKIKCTTRTVVRLGSTTPLENIYRNLRNREAVEINTVNACKISGNKILMKQAFDTAGVISAEWKIATEDWDVFPAIIKHKHSSKGNGIYYIPNAEEFAFWKEAHPNLKDYIIEKYFTYNREYRLHITSEGCFYTCRKMLKRDADVRWHRHDNNSVWILEENPLFDKPTNWDSIVEECVKAIKAVGLDIAAVDVKVQSAKEGRDPKYIILETNSAPSLGDITTIKYIEQLSKMCEK